MSPVLIVITGLIYAFIALEQFSKGHIPMGIMYSGYAFSNVGLWIMACQP